MKTFAYAALLVPVMTLANMSVAHADSPPVVPSAAPSTSDRPSIVFEARDRDGHNLEAVVVTMDGRPFTSQLDKTAIAVEPGTHSFTFETAGLPPREMTFTFLPGENDRHERVVFSPAHSSAAAYATAIAKTPAPAGLGPQKVAGLVVGGLGVVVLGVATGFGVDTLLKYNDADAMCSRSASSCPTQAGTTKWNSALSAGNLATYTLIAGGVLFTGGAALWLSAKDPSATESSAKIGIGMGTVQVKWSF